MSCLHRGNGGPTLRLCALRMLALAAIILGSVAARAQISLATAVDLALRSNPRVKSAEADVARARAAVSESRDAYIPSITVGAGLGQAYGYSNYPPTLFTVNAGSLIYNASQPHYIRSARAGLDAAQESLQDVRETVAEDTALTFLALDHDQERETVLQQQGDYTGKLVAIVQDRFDAGLDSHVDLLNARLSEANLRLARLRVHEDTETDRMHLSRLIGVPPGSLQAAGGFPASAVKPTVGDSGTGYANASVAAAFASAKAKQQQAYGDSHFLYRPQLSLASQFNRYATFTNAWATLKQQYHDISSSEAVFGVSVSLPLFDKGRQAKARETSAEAAKSLHDAENAQINVQDAQTRLEHTIELMQAQGEVASLQQQLAQDQLEIVRAQIANANSSPQPMTPKDEQNALIGERDKYLGVLDAVFQMHQAQVSYLRQTGHLEDWLLHAGLTAAPLAPAALQPHP